MVDFGLYLTPGEYDELVVRTELQDEAQAVRDYGETTAVGVYADQYIDQAAGGVLVVGFTDDPARHSTELARRFPFPARLRTYRAEHSALALNELRCRVASDLPLLQPALGSVIHDVGVDVRANDIVVGVDEPSPAMDALLGARYGPVRAIESGPVVDEVNYDRGRNGLTHGNPLRGGLSLRNAARERRCTSGFVMYDDNPRTYWLLTAAHCYSLQQGVYQGLQSDGSYRPINPLTRRQFSRTEGVDAGAVQIASGARSPYIYYHPNDYAHVISLTQHSSSDNVGDLVCIAGVYTPGTATGGAGLSESCGLIESRSNNGDNIRRADYCHRAGDSGAPIFSAYVARGVHHGGLDVDGDGEDPCTDDAIFGHIGNARLALSLNGAVTP